MSTTSGLPGTQVSKENGRRMERQETVVEDTKDSENQTRMNYRGFISPAVSHLLLQHPVVDIAKIQGTGESGRVTRRDVLKYLNGNGKNNGGALRDFQEVKPDPFSSAGKENDFMQTGTSQGYYAHIVRQVCLQQIHLHRQRSRQNNLHFTYSVYFAHAVIQALQEHPEMLAYWTPDGICQADHVVLSFQIFQSPSSTVNPTFMGLEKLSLVGLARVLRALRASAESGCLQPVAPKPGSFSIVNSRLGCAALSVPGIAWPQSAVLGIGSVQQPPAFTPLDALPSSEWRAENISAASSPFVYFALRYDCRAVQTGAAERFLQTTAGFLEAGP